MPLTFERDGQLHTDHVTPGRTRSRGRMQGCGIGVRAADPHESSRADHPVAAVPRSFVELGRVAGMTVQALGRLFSPTGTDRLGHQVIDTGSVATAPRRCGRRADEAPARRTSQPPAVDRRPVPDRHQSADSGVRDCCCCCSPINIFIGVFNLVPLLPFDGGHAAIAIYERIQERRRHVKGRYFVDVAKLLPLTYAWWLVLGLLFVSTRSTSTSSSRSRQLIGR